MSKRKLPPWLYMKRVYLIGAGVVLVLLLFLVMLKKDGETPMDTTAITTETVSSDVVFPWLENGMVCSKVNDFSFQIENPYQVILEGSEGIAINDTTGMLITVRKSGSDAETALVSYLAQNSIDYKQTGTSFTYTLPAEKSPDYTNDPVSAISRIKDRYIVSVFYGTGEESSADNVSQTVIDTITEGCANG